MAFVKLKKKIQNKEKLFFTLQRNNKGFVLHQILIFNRGISKHFQSTLENKPNWRIQRIQEAKS